MANVALLMYARGRFFISYAGNTLCAQHLTSYPRPYTHQQHHLCLPSFAGIFWEVCFGLLASLCS